MKGTRTQRVVEEIFDVLSNNAHNIWRTIGYGFHINVYGGARTIMCGATYKEVWWPLSTDSLVLCLHSIDRLESEEGRRIVESVAKTDEAQELVPLKLVFGRAKLELIEEIYEEGSYWGDTRIEYIYRVTPVSSDDIVAYAVLIPHRTVVPADISQLWNAIYDFVSDEPDKPIKL